MTNLRYAIGIIGALSLLLGLSLGQIYFLHERVDQLEFNRFRQSTPQIQLNITSDYQRHLLQENLERARRHNALSKELRRYNRELQRWEMPCKSGNVYYYIEE